ncbi:MAG: ABC transporter permease [Acidimicrobiales bacterium]
MTAATAVTVPVAPTPQSGWASRPEWQKWMAYAAAGTLVLAIVGQFTGTSMLTSSTLTSTAIKWSIPILLAGLGGLFSERCGVVNIGLEGMMIMGTWCGAFGAYHWGPWAGLVVGALGGAVGGLLHAVATVQFGVDHIISGVAINILAPGLARYMSESIFVNYDGGSATQSPHVDGLGDFTVPVLAGGKIFGWRSPDLLGNIEDRHWFLLSDIAGIVRGPFSQMRIFTLLALLCIPLTTYIFFRTRVGLRLRIAGERPAAGDSLGVDIYRYKYLGVLVSGALAGLAGAFIVMELTGLYQQNQTAARGFIALAALIFGNWRARGVFASSILFAYPLALSLQDLKGTSVRALLLVIAIALAAVVVWSYRRPNLADAIIAGVMSIGCVIWFATSETAPAWLPNTMPTSSCFWCWCSLPNGFAHRPQLASPTDEAIARAA